MNLQRTTAAGAIIDQRPVWYRDAYTGGGYFYAVEPFPDDRALVQRVATWDCQRGMKFHPNAPKETALHWSVGARMSNMVALSNGRAQSIMDRWLAARTA